jgi:hypothetical protein
MVLEVIEKQLIFSSVFYLVVIILLPCLFKRNKSEQILVSKKAYKHVE